MPLNYRYDPEYKIIRAEMTGRFDIERYKELMRDITSGTSFPPTTATIWDMREFDFVSFDIQVAEVLTNTRKKFTSRRGAMIAYVVASEVGYGMMRMFQIMTETEDTSAVFYDYDKAMEWTIQQGTE